MMTLRNLLLGIALLGGLLFKGKAQNIKASEASLARVEPTCWWVGMKNPRLQLMLYGKNLGGLQASISHKGVVLERAIQVKNPNYLFLDLLLDSPVPGKFDIVLSKDGNKVLSFPYELLAREPQSANREGFNNADVMYLVTPDRFANGNPGNDAYKAMLDQTGRNEPGGRHGGDIKGLRDHLDYLVDMGFTTLWLNPVLENNQPSYSYHGYATTDYYKVDARYGTNEEYRELALEAKRKGIKLIMDMIVNHCGSEHWWMKDLPTDDWLNHQQEGFRPTNHRREALQDPYSTAADRMGHADGWFVPSMPDLNQRNPLMAAYLIQNTIWWVEYAHLAGIRMDTYSYPDMHFMAEWNKQVLAEYPNLNIVGEEWSDNPAIVSHWQRGKKNPSGYESNLPSLMDFPLQSAISASLSQPESPYSSGLIMLYRMLANDFLYPDPYNLVVFADNHDMSRIFTQVGHKLPLQKMAMAYLLTTRGIPQVYYGTEVLMGNPGTDDHGVIRSDFPGGWAGDAKNAFTGEGLTAEEREMQAYLKKLLHWRKSNEAIHTGRLAHYAPEGGVYVLFRYNGKRKAMLVINKNEHEAPLPLARFAEHIGNAARGTDVATGQAFDLKKDSIALPGMSVWVLELE